VAEDSPIVGHLAISTTCLFNWRRHRGQASALPIRGLLAERGVVLPQAAMQVPRDAQAKLEQRPILVERARRP
jgi:hypothetical protein